jgi:hypothetical protein
MRALKAFALAEAIAIALIAGTLILPAFGHPPSAAESKLLPQRAAPSPIIIVGATIDVEPSSHTPLLIEIGPPEWVPRDSTLDIQGLPSGVVLSRGRRLSEDLWAVPIGDLANLRIEVATTAWGGSDLTLTLVAGDGRVLAEAHTRISINALTLAAADPSATSSPFEQRSEGAHLRPPPVEVPPAVGASEPTHESLQDGARSSASEGPSPAPAIAEELVRKTVLLGETPRETPTGDPPEPKPSVAPSAADRFGEVEDLSGAAPAHVRMAAFEITAIGAPAKQEPSRSGATSAAAEELGPTPAIALEKNSAIASSSAALVAPAHAQKCVMAGGWGTGVFESFAGYMAETAMKNSVKAKLGDEANIGAVTKRCEQKGLLIECTARARGCR